MAALGNPTRLFNAGDPPYGLIASAREAVRGRYAEPAAERPADGDAATDFPTSPDEESQYRWVLGMTIEPEPCAGGFLTDPCDADGPYGETPVEPTLIGPVQPFVATASIACGTFGTRYETRRDRVLRRLRAVRSFQLEREFWTGIRAIAQSYSANQWLTKAGSTSINFGAPMALATAFAELEQAIADASTWATGMIHCQPRTFAHWYRLRCFDKVGNIGISPLGTIVVSGRGYPGTGVQGTTSTGLGGDAAYAFATSLVQVRLGPETVLADQPNPGGVRGGPALDPSTNELLVTADQPISANWDGCVWAKALVLHTSELSATGS